jgi:hypothetical protein
MEQPERINIGRIVDMSKIVKTHCPSNIPVVDPPVVNYGYSDILPIILRSQDNGTVASLLTTTAFMKWLYSPKRKVYIMKEDGSMEEPAKANDMEELCKILNNKQGG